MEMLPHAPFHLATPTPKGHKEKKGDAAESKNRKVFSQRINHRLLLFSLPAMDKQQRLGGGHKIETTPAATPPPAHFLHLSLTIKVPPDRR